MNRDATTRVVLTGLMMAMVVVATIVIPIPVGFGNGYIHFGDAMIFLSVLLLGWRYGAIAAGVGSALADVLVGYAAWAPWTLVIKGSMGIVMGLFVLQSMKKQGKALGMVPVSQIVGMVLGGIVMVVGYFFAGGLLYGSYVIALAAVPWNILQFSVGVAFAAMVAAALYKTPARRYFYYQPGIDVSEKKLADS